jgi:hypothetical protein
MENNGYLVFVDSKIVGAVSSEDPFTVNYLMEKAIKEDFMGVLFVDFDMVNSNLYARVDLEDSAPVINEGNLFGKVYLSWEMSDGKEYSATKFLHAKPIGFYTNNS